MEIQIAKLEMVFQLLVNSAKVANCDKMEFSYDAYWSIPVNMRQLITEMPEPDIGSINHDLERLYQCLSSAEPMKEHFRYLGNVLIALSDTLGEHNIWL